MLFSHLGLLATLAANAVAQSSTVGIYSLATTIPWSPKAPSSVDQSIVYNNTYYLSDRSNAGIHVISLKNNSQITLISGFVTTLVNGTVSSKASGPNGLIVLPDRDELWVGDGDGTVKVISLLNYKIIANITTGSKARADEFGYDSKNGIVVVTNPNEATPFVSVIGVANRTVLGKILFPTATELEQPAWNSNNGLFYISVPSSEAFASGSISTLSLANMSIKATYGLPECIPAGIVFGPNQNMFVGCSQDQITESNHATSYVINGTNGAVIANISGLAGIDQVAYDSVANLYYASAYQMLANGSKTGAPMPIMGVINASSNALIQNITTDNVTAHSVAVDTSTGAMIVPIMAKGIQIFNLSGSKEGQSPSSSAIPTATKTGSSSTATASGSGGGASDIQHLSTALFVGASILTSLLVL